MKRVKLIVDGKTIRAQPPIVGDYCKVPSSGHVDKPCGKPTTACSTPLDPQTCPRCEFSYCRSHYEHHIIQFVAPVDAWLTAMRRLKAGLKRIAVNPRRTMRPFGPTDKELAKPDA